MKHVETGERAWPRETSAGSLATKVVAMVALAIMVAVVPLKREFILGTTQEFANYGDLARHLLAGDGVCTGLGQPVDLRYLRDLHGHGTPPPWPTLFRPLGPVAVTASLMRVFGDREWTVIAPALFGFIATIGLTVITGELFFGRWIGVLAALPYLASRPILSNAFNSYPDSIFSANICLIVLVFLLEAHGRCPGGTFVLGLCAGLGQLARVNMVGLLPCFAVVLWPLGPSKRRVVRVGLFMLGFAIGGSPEWAYALRNTGMFTRSLVGLENLANVKYGQAWLWYVPLSASQILVESWPDIMRGLVHNAPRLALQVLSGVEGPVEGAGLVRRGVILVLFLSGVALWRRIYPDHIRRLYVLVVCLALWQVAMFAVLRQGLRYFYWFIPICWLFVLLNACTLAHTIIPKQRRLALGFGSACLSLALLGNAFALIAGVRTVNAEMHGFSPAQLRAVREIQIPALRRLVPVETPIASDRAFVLWYLGNPTIPLPLDAESLAGIERDYFAIDYIYLTGPFFEDMPGDPEDYVRAYFVDGGGVVAKGRSTRLALFLHHFPTYAIAQEFADGGVVLARNCNKPAPPGF